MRKIYSVQIKSGKNQGTEVDCLNAQNQNDAENQARSNGWDLADVVVVEVK
jgi:hypothetical protein